MSKHQYKKRIFCAGASRSGSTWQYNAVRLMAKELHASVYGAWVADYDEENPSELHIVKLHALKDMVFPDSPYVVTSYRNLADVMNSILRMGWEKNPSRQKIFEWLDDYIQSQAGWASKAAIVTRYEDIMTAPRVELEKLATALRFPLGAEQLDRIAAAVAEVRPPGDEPTELVGYDRETLLHPGHIGRADDNSKLTAEDRAAITQRYGDWLRARGYL